MLRWRLLSAAVILSLLLALAALDYLQIAGMPPGGWLIWLLLLVSLLAAEESLSLFAAKEWRPLAWPVYAGTLAVAVSFALPIVLSAFGVAVTIPASVSLLALAGAATLVFAAEMQRFHGPEKHVVHIALAVFTIVYVGVLGGFLTELRLLGNDNRRGMSAFVSLLLIVKASDAGAYMFGRLLGRTKMTPRLSPGKTIEGAIGGMLTACIVSACYFQLVAPQLMHSTQYVPPGWLHAAIYGFILAAFGIVGDLAESLVKRDMERKDSSTWLPGLGGVLDVIDSLLVAAPAAYLCWKLGLVW